MLSGQIPILVLKEGSTRESGKDAQRNNIEAAKAIADTVKSALGPKGMDIFGNVTKSGNQFVSSYSESLSVIATVSGKKEISVETRTSPGSDQEKIVKLYNQFLEEVTGYTAKERKKLMSKI